MYRLRKRKSLVNIGNEIGGVFDTARKTHKIGADASCGKLFVIHLAMSCICRMKNTGASIGDMGSDLRLLQVSHEALCRFAPAFYTKAHNTA